MRGRQDHSCSLLQLRRVGGVLVACCLLLHLNLSQGTLMCRRWIYLQGLVPRVRLTTAHLVGALEESMNRLGLWDVAGAARLQRVGHCYTLQPWGIGMGED